MSNNRRINDPFTNKARDGNLVARSFYKLEEIDKKYQFFDGNVNSVVDIGCAPGSWLQYVSQKLSTNNTDFTAIGFDLKPVKLTLKGVTTYAQDITEHDKIKTIFDSHNIEKVDVIISDMAPDTIGMKDIDALRSIALIEKTLWIYENYLKDDGKFAIKVFMGPGFDELVRELKQKRGVGSVCVFKPKACRKSSKETYIIKKN